MSEEINFEDMVRQLAKPGEDILATLDPLKAHLLHMAVGVSGEAGELLDAIKKFVIYNKDLDTENVIEELGDMEFYMEGLRDALKITRAGTIEANIAKLGKRYKGHSYSDAQAQDRADKEEPHRPLDRMPAKLPPEVILKAVVNKGHLYPADLSLCGMLEEGDTHPLHNCERCGHYIGTMHDYNTDIRNIRCGFNG